MNQVKKHALRKAIVQFGAAWQIVGNREPESGPPTAEYMQAVDRAAEKTRELWKVFDSLPWEVGTWPQATIERPETV